MKNVALVTGASAGLGVDFARQLSERGHRLVLAARRKDRLDALAKELGKARAIAIDLSKPNAAAKLMATAEKAASKSEKLALYARVEKRGKEVEDARKAFDNIKALIDKYGVHFDPAIRDQVIARYKALELPTYWGGVNPKLTAQLDAKGNVTSVLMSYPRDAVKQYLEYGAMYRR